MTRDETVARFLECESKRAEALAAGKSEDEAHEAAKTHWNAWAESMLAKRKELEQSNLWAVNKSLEPENAETHQWISEAKADFSSHLFLVRDAERTKGAIAIGGKLFDFRGFVFPGYALFYDATFKGNARFISAAFKGNASFSGAVFEGFSTWFASATFEGTADFGSTITFKGESATTFKGEARFDGATFKGSAIFPGAIFERANFSSAAFHGDANFHGSTFKDYASFRDATFKGNARFISANFKGGAAFNRATFNRTVFEGDASFVNATFSCPAFFQRAAFSRTSFDNATFSADVWFRDATFTGDARFRRATFQRDAIFVSVDFASDVRCRSATFEGNAFFRGARFRRSAGFYAIRGERGFEMTAAQFEVVPEFIQAHFEEAPRLDNVKVNERLPPLPEKNSKDDEKLLWRERLHREWQDKSALYRRATSGLSMYSPLRDVPARWRALKRLAIQGHDTDRELQFFSGEVRSARFAGDWPLPWPLWKSSAWGGCLRFYAGWLYQVFSDFGRSLLRPFLAWVFCIVIFAVYFLGQNPDMAAKREELHRDGFIGQVIAYGTVALDQFRKPVAPYCYPGTQPKPGETKGVTDGFSGLVEDVRATTNLVNEALSIAYHNALIVLDSSGDSAHRAFGCLYGVERYGGNPVAFVPRSVAIASGIQKLLSAIFIFLFGLALRNMLKVK